MRPVAVLLLSLAAAAALAADEDAETQSFDALAGLPANLKKAVADLSRPWMRAGEISAVAGLIKPTANYLEWGTGGSTWTYAIRAKRARCIEHSGGWCKSVQETLDTLKPALDEADKTVEFYCEPVENGRRGWKGGFEEGTYHQFDHYVNKIHDIGVAKESLDVVLVDGRARVACALTVIPYLRADGVVLIHDFTWRPHYKAVLEYYDIVEKVKTLVVLRPKAAARANPPSIEVIHAAYPPAPSPSPEEASEVASNSLADLPATLQRAVADLSRPWMRESEIAAVAGLIKPTANYLEWGTGGSTWTYAIRAKHARCIEHSGGWCSSVQETLDTLKPALDEADKTVEFYCQPVADGHRGWTGGFEEGTYHQFDDYVNKIHEIGVAKESLDVVLIDGRARVACALTVIPYLRADGVVLIHDYSWRPHYKPVLEYYEVVEKVKTLVVLRPKQSARDKPPTAQDIQAVYVALAEKKRLA